MDIYENVDNLMTKNNTKKQYKMAFMIVLVCEMTKIILNCNKMRSSNEIDSFEGLD